MALNKTYTLIKDNITIYALIPTVTGGIWQMIKLLQISPNMIRFFSLSQMISDSVLIILFFSVPFISFFIILIDVFYDEEGRYHFDNYQRFSIFKKFIALALISLAFIFLFHLNDKIEINSNKILLISLVSVAGIFTFLRYCLLSFLRNNETAFSFFIAIYSAINFLLISSTIDNITKDLNDINNFTSLITKMENEQCYSNKPKILYFNDKYIFIEIEIKSEKSFIIKKLDDIFF